MRAARMKHRVTLQSPTGTVDTAGGVSGWTDVATVWAAIEPIRGSERPARDKFVDEVDTLIVIRWRTAVLPTWRVKHAETCCGVLQYYGVQAVIAPRESRRAGLELTCRRVDSGDPAK